MFLHFKNIFSFYNFGLPYLVLVSCLPITELKTYLNKENELCKYDEEKKSKTVKEIVNFS